MRRADRLFQIFQVLRRTRKPLTAEAIAKELETSKRTIYRDIATLIGQRVPIRGEAGVGYVLGQGYDLPPLMFTTDEVEAVMLGLRWVMRRGDPDLVRAAQDAVAKVATVLPEELRPVFADASLLVPPSWRMIEDTVDVAPLRRAIREQRKVRISYSNESGIASQRVIWPFAISYFDAQRLIVSWCELRGAFRTFRTDRMVEAEVLADKYRERRAVLLKRWSEEQGISAE